MSEAEEIAKAVQDAARFGEKSLEAGEKLGGFFAKVLKELVQEITGMITDKLRFVRWRRLSQMADAVNKILLKCGVTETRAVPPKLALPIFEGASLEENENLQDLWNNLLANAMNPQFNSELRYGFVDMIKNITAIEASILNNLYQILKKEGKITHLSRVTDYTFDNNQIMMMMV